MSIDKQELVRRVSQRVERETGTIELLELDKSGIHVAEYLTVLPSKELLQAKLQESIAAARRRLQS
jgi:hypothetical protein